MKSRISTRTIRFGSVAVALVALAFVFTASPARMSEVPGVTIDNFAKVDDHYYRGSQPDQEQLAQLKHLGIKTVIDLREDYKKAEETWVRDLGMNFFRIPLKTRVAATEEQTTYFLNLISDPANWPVYVHCKGGRHRTGAMTGIYRITHDGWTADEAYREMKKYDFENGFFGGPSAQRKFVFSFYERHHTPSAAGQK